MARLVSRSDLYRKCICASSPFPIMTTVPSAKDASSGWGEAPVVAFRVRQQTTTVGRGGAVFVSEEHKTQHEIRVQ